MSSWPVIRYRLAAYSLKYASSLALPVAIAKVYGTMVNGDVQLLIAGSSYLGLLDSGMTINALNRGGTSGGSPQEKAEYTLRHQLRSSNQIFLIGVCIAGTLLSFAAWCHVISTDLLFAGSLLAVISVLEISMAPYKYHLYSHGFAGIVEKREAWISTIATIALGAWSLLILSGFLPQIIGLPVGLLLLRSDRVASGVLSLRDLLSIANSNEKSIRLMQVAQASVPYEHNQADDRLERFWISALQVLALLNWSADIFLIKFIVGAPAVSDYSIYSKLFMIPASLVTLASPVIQSGVSQGKLRSSSFAQIANCSWPIIIFTTMALAMICQLALVVFPSLPGQIGLTRFPSIYLLLCFSFLSMISVVSAFYAPIANGLHLFKYQVVVSAIFLPSNIVLSWVFGGSLGLGMVGVIAATCLTMSVTSCLLVPREIVKMLRCIANKRNHDMAALIY